MFEHVQHCQLQYARQQEEENVKKGESAEILDCNIVLFIVFHVFHEITALKKLHLYC